MPVVLGLDDRIERISSRFPPTLSEFPLISLGIKLAAKIKASNPTAIPTAKRPRASDFAVTFIDVDGR